MNDSARDAFVVGEALTDIVDGPAGIAEYPGGSPMNVAIGLARLGVPTTLHTRIGTDGRGAAIAAHVADSGVRLSPGSVTDRPTATARARLDESATAAYRFTIDGELAPIALPGPVGLVHTGSIAAVLDPGSHTIEEFLRSVRDRVLVSFDPNVRPAITPDREAVLSRVTALMALAHVVKLSEEDAQWLYPGDRAERVTERILGLGPRLVAVTRGGHGSVLARSGGEVISLPAAPSRVVDTIGAGDAFMAGLLAGMARSGAMDRVRRGQAGDAELRGFGELGARAAAMTVGRHGADPPTWDELMDDAGTLGHGTS